MAIRTFFFISFLLPKIIFAQVFNYQPGFIVIAKDTITTLINRTSETDLSKSITVKTNGSVQSYRPSELASFEFKSDRLSFAAVEVDVKLPNATVSEKRFAKVLLRGKVSLYKLYLEQLNPSLYPENDYIYIIKKDEFFYPLIQHEDPSGNSYALRKKYVGMLTALFNDCNKLEERDFQNLEFYDAQMIEIIDKYNRCKAPGEQSTIVNYKVKPIAKKSVELSYSTFIPADEDVVTASRAFSVGYLWDILRPDMSTRHSLLTGLSYMNLNYDYDNYIDKTTITEHFLKFKVQDQYNIGKLNQKVIPFTSLGASIALSKSQSYQGIGTIAFLGIGGGIYLDKIRISALCETMGLKLKKSNKLIHFSLAYRINKQKLNY